MSPLWSGKTKTDSLIYQSNPSSTRKDNSPDSARNPESSQCNMDNCPNVKAFSIEGISLSASLNREVSAGMTVEASVLLPLFLFFFLNLGCAIELIRLHGNLQLALWETGSRLALYGYVLDSGETPADEEREDVWWKGLAGAVLAPAYVKSQLIDILGEAYLEQSPLAYGTESLKLWESEIFGAEDEVDIIVTYSVSPLHSLSGFSPFRMANRYYAHIWNGYRLPDTAEEESVTVFLTENGQVYHLNRNCTHLQLSIHQILSVELEGIRNKHGGRYQPCEKCAEGKCPAVLFVTDEGDRYHYSRKCSGLKRTVYSMTLEEAAVSFRPCSRCGAGT